MTERKVCPCCHRGFRDAKPEKSGPLGPPFRRLLLQAADEAGITNVEIARRLDVTPSAVSQVLKRESMSERVFRDYTAAMGFEIKLVKKTERKTNGKPKEAKRSKKP